MFTRQLYEGGVLTSGQKTRPPQACNQLGHAEIIVVQLGKSHALLSRQAK